MKTTIATFSNDFVVIKLSKFSLSKSYCVTFIYRSLNSSYREYYSDLSSALSRFREYVCFRIS